MELISRSQYIVVKDFLKQSEMDKSFQVETKVKELKNIEENHKIGLKIELGKDHTSEKTARYLNRMIKSIRGETTVTDVVVEIYETILKTGETKNAHWLIHKVLDSQVPVSSIRRILSQYRHGKLG